MQKQTYEELAAENARLRALITRTRPATEPHPVLDYVRVTYNVRNDSALAREIGVAPPQISRIRHREMRLSEFIMVRLHERFDIPFKKMRELMKDEK